MSNLSPTAGSVARTSHVPAPAVFLGSLASEVNEPDELDSTFATLADVTERVVAAVRNGQLDEQDAAAHLQALRLTGHDEVTWTIGATSLRWYHKTPERGWKLAVPPTSADDAHQACLTDALTALPAHLIAQAATGGGGPAYGSDPFAAVADTPTAPWEYEPGDQRRHTYDPEGDPSLP